MDPMLHDLYFDSALPPEPGAHAFSFFWAKAPGLCLELERSLSKERGAVDRGSNSVQAVSGLLQVGLSWSARAECFGWRFLISLALGYMFCSFLAKTPPPSPTDRLVAGASTNGIPGPRVNV